MQNLRPLAKLGFALAIIVLMLACLNGCTRNGNQDADRNGVITIEFWNGFTGPDGETMEKIVTAFNKSHPGIKVHMQIIPWNTYYDKVTLGLAYGGAPDVFILHTDRMPEYADVDAISRLDDLVATGELKESDFMERPWAAGRWKDRQYAIPLDCHPIGLYYNTKLFKAAGIVDAAGNAKPPTNLREFVEAGRKLTIDKNNDGKPEQWGYAFTWLRTNAQTFLTQHGTSWLTPDVKRSDLTSENAAVAFRMMTDLIHKYHVCPPPEGQDAWMGFRTGKVAMALEGIYMLSDAQKQEGLEFAGAPCPQFGPKRAVWGGSHLLAMPAKVSPAHRKASWEFIKYLSENSLEWAKGGQVPVRKSILAKPEFKELSVQYEFGKQLDCVMYLPQSTKINQVMPFCDASVEAILNGIKPADEALADAAGRINRVLERP